MKNAYFSSSHYEFHYLLLLLIDVSSSAQLSSFLAFRKNPPSKWEIKWTFRKMSNYASYISGRHLAVGSRGGPCHMVCHMALVICFCLDSLGRSCRELLSFHFPCFVILSSLNRTCRQAFSKRDSYFSLFLAHLQINLCHFCKQCYWMRTSICTYD